MPPEPAPTSPPAPASPAYERHLDHAPALPIQKGTDRVSAAIEVVLCSGFPSQIAIAYLLAVSGLAAFEPDGRLSFTYVAALSLLDALLLIGLIVALLRLHGERPHEVFLGPRPVGREALLGLPLTPVVFGIAMAIMAIVSRVAPWMHNVPKNPLEDLIRTPLDATVFVFVAIIGGGLREEIQRAFILRRFEQHLGGGWIGLIVFSAIFGAGHAIQGLDAVVGTTTLGLLWGAVYLTRRSIVAPVVSHAGFNTAEIVRYALMN